MPEDELPCSCPLPEFFWASELMSLPWRKFALLTGETPAVLIGLFLHNWDGVCSHFFIIFFMVEMWVHNYCQSLCTYMVLNIEEQFSIYSFIEA